MESILGFGNVAASKLTQNYTWYTDTPPRFIMETLLWCPNSAFISSEKFSIMTFFWGGSGGKAKEKKNTWHGSVSGTKRWRFKKICPGPPVSSSIFWFQSCRWKGDSWHVRLHNMCCITCPSLKQTTSSYSCWFLCWDYLQISNVPDKDLFVVDIFSWTWSFFTSFTLKN